MRLPFVFVLAAAVASAAGYHLARRIDIGGEGGWDYVAYDSLAHRLYVSHATKVVVVDADTEKVVGEIADTPGVHGIALVVARNRGYITAGRANQVVVFDTKTLETKGRIATGQNPDAVLYDAVSDHLFVFNGRSKDATVIDTATNTVLATLPLGGKPEFAVADGRGSVFVNIEDTHEVAVIDAKKAAVAKRYTLTACEDPTGLAIDAAQRRLFSVCKNKTMVVSNPDTGTVVATVGIGAGSDGAGFDADKRLAFSSNGEGTLTVVSGAGGTYRATATVPTVKSARTMVVDPRSHKIYLPAAEGEGTARRFQLLVVEP